MGIATSYFLSTIVVGTGATLITDLWALFLKGVLGIPSLSFCLVGRWFLHMREGRFRHPSIAAAQKMQSECIVGLIAHYLIGVVYAFVLIGFASDNWLTQPTLAPALSLGITTVAFPFLLMQPSFGLGVAVSKTPKPTQARLKSLVTHIVFGVGLYISALGVSYVLRIHS